MSVTKLVPKDNSGNIIKVNEDSSCTIKWTLFDDDKVTPIPGSLLNTATMTIYNKTTGAIVNSRDDEDVKANFSESGVFSLNLLASDNPFLSTVKSLEEEVHIAKFTINCTVGTVKDLVVDYWIYVERTYDTP